jgi:hypothetical protein
MTQKNRPFVYIASPYTKGDPCVNARFQCKVFDQLLGDGLVLPYAPLISHFQHTMFPRPYQDWVQYDLDIIPRFDACLRLDSEGGLPGYKVSESSGADGEVKLFAELKKPVYYSIGALYAAVKAGSLR